MTDTTSYIEDRTKEGPEGIPASIGRNEST